MADPQPPEPPTNGTTETLTLAAASKRQRRPSVRLGDLGGQPATTPTDPHTRRTKQWKLHPSSDDLLGKPFSNTRPLTNLRRPASHQTLKSRSPPSSSAAAHKRALKSRSLRRVRTNWVFKGDEGDELRSSAGEEDEGYVEDSDTDSGLRDSKAEGDAPSEMDNRDWGKQKGRLEQNGDGGVLSWLNRLGLGQYSSVFEIHEVDDEVLPMLTLDDLRDMGINAVGSRRKMYCAIQKLRKDVT